MERNFTYTVFMRLTEMAVSGPEELGGQRASGAEDAQLAELLQELHEISIMADALGARLDRLMERKLMALSTASGIAPVQ